MYRPDSLPSERMPAIEQTGIFGAMFEGCFRNGFDVFFVGLFEVAGVGVHLEPLFGQPGNGHPCIESAGIGNADFAPLLGQLLIDASHASKMQGSVRWQARLRLWNNSFAFLDRPLYIASVAVTKEQKQLYNEKVQDYKTQADDLKKEVSMMKAAARKNSKLAPYLQAKAAVLGIQRANILVLMSRLSHSIQNIKNESFLSDARKEMNTHIGDLAKIAGEHLPDGFTENQDTLPRFAKMTVAHRLQLMGGFYDCINNIKETMGNSSKWRWSFPDTYMRLLVLCRNLLDLKDFERTKDPTDENYRPYQEYMRLMMEISQTTAQEFRQKYELSTREVGDLQKTEKVFAFQKQIYGFIGQKEELERATNALDNVKEMIESIMAEKKGKKKKKKRKK